jgi:NAD(P)-dependent dehydrogenase (short-subunit alcohol dehydrogenase family)
MEASLPDAARFAGRAAIVTGAARGIGAATARRLAAEGAPEEVASVIAFLASDDAS